MQYEERYIFYSETGAELTKTALKKAGIYPNRNGYEYIIHAVDLLIKYGKTELNKLYEKVGLMYGVRANRVASSISYTLKTLCGKDEPVFEEMGVAKRRELTVKELIFLLYDLVLSKLKKQFDFRGYLLKGSEQESQPLGCY